MNLRYHNQQFLIVVLSFIFTITQFQVIQSQPNVELPIYTGTSVRNLAWSSGSQTLSFMDISADRSTFSPGNWFVYDVTTMQLTTQDNWPLQPSLSATEKQLYQVATNTSGYDSFILTSPNGHYLTYSSTNTLSNGRLATAIVDLQSQNIIITSLPSVGASNGPDEFMAYWSPDNNAMVLEIATLQTTESLFYFVDNLVVRQS